MAYEGARGGQGKETVTTRSAVVVHIEIHHSDGDNSLVLEGRVSAPLMLLPRAGVAYLPLRLELQQYVDIGSNQIKRTGGGLLVIFSRYPQPDNS